MPAQPQSIQFDRLPLEGSVNDILQDQLGFLWFATDVGLIRFDGYEFIYYTYDPKELAKGLLSNSTICLLEDHNGNLWIGAVDGLNFFDRTTETFTHYTHFQRDSIAVQLHNVHHLLEDSFGKIWIACSGAGLFCLDPKNGDFKQYVYKKEDPNSLSQDYILTVYLAPDSTFWLGMSGLGLSHFDPRTETFTHYTYELPQDMELAFRANVIRDIYPATGGKLWLATYGGLLLFDPSTGSFKHWKKDNSDPYALKEASLWSINPDGKGALWIATYGGGLVHFDPNTEQFTAFTREAKDPNSLSNDQLFKIYTDRAGTLWVGLHGALNKWDPLSRPLQKKLWAFPSTKFNPDYPMGAALQSAGGDYWWGTVGGGLFRFNPETNAFQNWRYNASNPNSLGNDQVLNIREGSQGNIWICTGGGGLNDFHPKTQTFIRYQRDQYWKDNYSGIDHNYVSYISPFQLSGENADYIILTANGLSLFNSASGNSKRISGNANIFTAMQDRSGILWMGLDTWGLFRIDLGKQEQHQYFTRGKENYYFQSGTVNSIYESKSGTLWVGTGGGLAKYLKEEERFHFYTKEDGLPNENINQILEDHNGHLWLSTMEGLCWFDPVALTFRNFKRADGLLKDNGTYFVNRAGEICWIGQEGIYSFDPNRILKNPNPPLVVLTGLDLFNQPVPISSGGGKGKVFQLPQSIFLTRSLTLRHNQNFIGFHFSALNYTHPEKNQFTYQLEGVDPEWVQAGNRRYAAYPNLRPGRYTFKVKASNNDGMWNEKGTSIEINILSPWWKTPWAYVVFSILALGMLYGFYLFQLSRRLAQAEAHRLRELDDVKNKLYANITHEFRTPLTVIQGLTDQLEKSYRVFSPDKVLNMLGAIKNNSYRLLRLVKQMLELSEVESGVMTVNAIQGNIINYLRYIVESFHSYTESKKIHLTLYSEVDQLNMAYDPEKILTILSNLISNAIKFTPEEGTIILHVNHQKEPDSSLLIIKIRDNGSGIAPEQLPYIFDRFYHTKPEAKETSTQEGTGIGLALTRELVKLMGGEIRVKSELGRGTEFAVLLPVILDKELPTSEYTSHSIKEMASSFIQPKPVLSTPSQPQGIGLKQKPILLIIEDNADVIEYLKICLEQDYQLMVSYDGQEGIDKALEQVPDIVISDVMMPRKDGFEVCALLKNDVRTSHIPIILLTAKADENSRIQGLRKGADAYLAKPFNQEELQVRLENLLELRQQLQERYRTLELSTPPQPNSEDLFVQKAWQVIERHLDDENFGIYQLCRELGLGRTQLHNKLKAVTNRSTSHFIRSIRLQKAKQLLESSDLTVSQIAFEVGFKDPNYFSRVYKEEFGKSPTEHTSG